MRSVTQMIKPCKLCAFCMLNVFIAMANNEKKKNSYIFEERGKNTFFFIPLSNRLNIIFRHTYAHSLSINFFFLFNSLSYEVKHIWFGSNERKESISCWGTPNCSRLNHAAKTITNNFWYRFFSSSFRSFM